MTTFIVRIELHNAFGSDYTNLHHAMSSEGFSNTIHGDDGKTYKLPTAQYSATTDSTLNTVYDAAKRASQKTINQSNTSNRFSILASNTNGNMWIGLDTI
ncbi:type V toxin-antitoxin system endoribonuclease antitoxin GhoS [Gluconobacter frateurii]|uniref:DUF2622 domain-containing protein n=1 Tax=Gluconobacter frateurii NRIC 0228 TaxID=1307946 RepID=A0ABQ0QC91_9PROT|nr:type V toxin-antitoxin system endoribonuclease antitoxin GhoS [Gluconobacter frateurii]GBR12793.1 hypothetical protein AA0228_1826 [Gluconobacter frateurii NRIC 0228]GLP89556.1 hypothetical protein GCM10007868_06310 [Gluconobacter frateurii]